MPLSIVANSSAMHRAEIERDFFGTHIITGNMRATLTWYKGRPHLSVCRFAPGVRTKRIEIWLPTDDGDVELLQEE